MPIDESRSATFDSTASSLLDEVKSGDADAWRRLVRIYGPLIFQWCSQFGLNNEDSADVSQEVFRAIAVGISGFRRDRPGDSFRGWLYTVTRNKVRDFARAQADRQQAVGGTDYHQFLQQTPGDADKAEASSAASNDGGFFSRSLEAIRAEFETRSWQAFWRTAVDEQIATFVAAELGMSPTAVRKAKSRVLRRLREMLVDPLED